MSSTYPGPLNEESPDVRAFLELLHEADYRGAGLTNNAFARHNRFLREFAPRLEEAMAFSERPVIEIGCGVGSVTHALARLFREVDAYDISPVRIDLVNRRKEIFRLDNLRPHVSPPEELMERALDTLEPNSVVMLYAVLEHMTETERLGALEMIWRRLGPDNFVYVGNTPNRFSWYDAHTHQQPFLLSLPDRTLHRYLQIHDDVPFARQLGNEYERGGWEAFSEFRARRGLGVSFHDFEIALEDAELNECIVLADIGQTGHLHDVLLNAFFLEQPIDVPMCFAVRDMNFLFKKPTPAECAVNRKHNRRVRAERAAFVAKRLSAIATGLQKEPSSP
jgi:2-polyprenyl-3-methyl-5-hydroxy-6-metoxy-1,4-benzoquinol methylase